MRLEAGALTGDSPPQPCPTTKAESKNAPRAVLGQGRAAPSRTFPFLMRTWGRRRGQQPGLRLHHVPVAEEDEAAKVAGVVPLDVLHHVLPTQGAAVAVPHRAHPDVPSHRQEGHLQGERGRGAAARLWGRPLALP